MRNVPPIMACGLELLRLAKLARTQFSLSAGKAIPLFFEATFEALLLVDPRCKLETNDRFGDPTHVTCLENGGRAV